MPHTEPIPHYDDEIALDRAIGNVLATSAQLDMVYDRRNIRRFQE